MSIHRIVTTLGLAALCLCSARLASADSVTGGGTLADVGIGTAVSIWARTTDQGPRGSVRFGTGSSAAGVYLLATVVDVEVDGNVALVTGVITQSARSEFVGQYLVVRITDYGPSGDLIQWTVVGLAISSEEPIAGNFVVIDDP